MKKVNMEIGGSEVVLDSNIFISALTLGEERRSKALHVLQWIDAQDIDIFEPSLVVFEFTSVLQRKQMARELTAQEASRALELFLKIPVLLQWQDFVLRKAISLAMQLGLKNAYDCSYLAVASAREIPLITADLEFVKKAKAIYPQIVSLDDMDEESDL